MAHTHVDDDPPPIDAQTPASEALQRVRTLLVAAVVALVLLGLAWELWLAPTGRGTLAIKVLPLAVALPGIWRYRLFTHRWLSLLVWLYVLEGLLRATTEPPPVRWLASAEVLLAVGLFVGCVVHVRLRFAGRRALAAGARP